jgi:hypothetical protein
MIKTVMLYRQGNELSLPVIRLNSGGQLELRFDDLSSQPRNFSYTLVHCNTMWEPSDIEPQEYLGGFGSGHIERSFNSFNTTRDYRHYMLSFPSEDAIPLISGNYALVVYSRENPDDILLIREFFVTDDAITLEAKVRQPMGEKHMTGQELEITLLTGGYSINDPAGDLTIIARQNSNPHSEKIIRSPAFVNATEIRYGGNGQIVFDGGNEYRVFDSKSMKFESEHIAHIDFQNPWYHVFLYPDAARTFDPYFSRRELNGNFYIDKEGSTDRHTEADYVYVHFQSPSQIPYADGGPGLTGAFCDWTFTPEYQLSYNVELRLYEKELLLKQGYYNYAYAFMPPGNRYPDTGQMEGNHHETENDFVIFVYHNDTSWDYDRLILVKQMNTKRP